MNTSLITRQVIKNQSRRDCICSKPVIFSQIKALQSTQESTCTSHDCSDKVRTRLEFKYDRYVSGAVQNIPH